MRSRRGWVVVVQPKERTKHGWLTFTRAEARLLAKTMRAGGTSLRVHALYVRRVDA